MSDDKDMPEVKLSAFRFTDRKDLPPHQSNCNDSAQNHDSSNNSHPRRLDAYNSGLATDKPGHELAPDATIWNLYVEEASAHDQELVKGRHASLDMLLLFAALFSAILTAFIIESKNLLEQDPTDVSVSLLLLIAQSQQRMELGLPPPDSSTLPNIPDFTPSSSALWINGIWFVSLAISLSAALLAMLGKEWLTAFLASRPRSPYNHTLLRQSRLEGLERWWALHIISLLPSLLHLALLLFSIGLVIYLWTMSTGLAAVIATITGLTFSLYVLTVILGATFEFCPFVTEISEYLRIAVVRICDRHPAKCWVTSSNKDLQALSWLASNSRDPEIVDYAYQALAGLRSRTNKVQEYNNRFKNQDISTSNGVGDNVPMRPNQVITLVSLLQNTLSRFERIMTNRRVVAMNGGAHIARYATAVSGMMNLIKRAKQKWPDEKFSSLVSPLKLIALIETIWSVNAPPFDANAYASLLAAEMELLNLSALDLAEEISDQPAWQSNVERTNLYPPTPIHSDTHVIHIPPPDYSARLDYRLEALRACYSRTLVRISQLCRFHMYGEIFLEANSLVALMDSICATACCELLNPLDSVSTHHPAIDHPEHQKYSFTLPISHNDSVTIPPDNLRLGPLGSIIFILRIRSDVNEDQLLRTRMSAVDAFSTLAPVLLQQLFGLDRAKLQGEYDFRSWPYKPGANLLGIGYITVRQMLMTLRNLRTFVQNSGEHMPFFNDVLQLIFECVEDTKRSGYDHGPRLAITHGSGDLVSILEFDTSSEQDSTALPDNIVVRLLDIVRLSLAPGAKTLCDTTLTPQCFLALIKMANRRALNADYGKHILECMIRRIEYDPFQLGKRDIPESKIPSVVFLHCFTRTSQGFPTLVEASIRNETRGLVVDAIVMLVHIASSRNSVPSNAPIELQVSAAPGFLGATTLVVKTLSEAADRQETLSKFLEDVFSLLVASSRHADFKDLIVGHPAFQDMWLAIDSIEGYRATEGVARMRMDLVP
ncbi:hypothetical protein FRC09_017079 [Ceratobasidium sp. 395]|nr:hypothetical protein FRC09_017079 [Ceratobasidium sp. 395]